MECDDPDLQAFKSNLRRILRERESGKTAALVSNLCPNVSDPQSIGVSSKDNARHESHCGTSSQSDSEDLPDDHETSSEWKFEGHMYFDAGPGRWPAGKAYEDAVRAAVKEQYLPSVPVPVRRMELFHNSAAEPDTELLKLPIRGYVQEAEGASERPDAIEYLSVHCDISPLILGSTSEAQKVPVRGFLQTAKTSWNSLWERWLPDFPWRPVRGGLCGNKDFQKSTSRETA